MSFGTMTRLAEMIIKLYEDPQEFEEWLTKMQSAGVINYKKQGKYYTISGRVNTALSTSLDPLTNLISLGFAFFGEYWAFMPDTDRAFNQIKNWWKDHKEEVQKHA